MGIRAFRSLSLFNNFLTMHACTVIYSVPCVCRVCAVCVPRVCLVRALCPCVAFGQVLRLTMSSSTERYKCVLFHCSLGQKRSPEEVAKGVVVLLPMIIVLPKMLFA